MKNVTMDLRNAFGYGSRPLSCEDLCIIINEFGGEVEYDCDFTGNKGRLIDFGEETKFIVYIREDQYEFGNNYALAIQIGKLFFGRGYLYYPDLEYDFHGVCEKFARDLLIPVDTLFEKLDKITDNDTDEIDLYTLALEFNVGVDVLKLRMVDLGILEMC